MQPFSQTTVHFGFLITNTSKDFVVLSEDTTIVARQPSLGKAMSWAKTERKRQEALDTLVDIDNHEDPDFDVTQTPSVNMEAPAPVPEVAEEAPEEPTL